MSGSRRGGIGFALVTALALLGFASNSLLCRAALAQRRVDPATFTIVRIAAGALALLVLSWTRHRRRALAGSSWLSAAALFAYAAAFSFAYVKLPAGTGALVLFGAVQIAMIGTAMVEGHRPSPAQIAAVGLSGAGLVALTFPGLAAPDPFAVGLMVVAGASWAAYSLRGRKASTPLSATAGNFVRAVPLAALAAPFALHAGHVTASGLALGAVSGALTSGVAYALWYAVLPDLGATRAALVQTAAPVLAALAGIGLLGERPDLRLALGATAVIGGVYVGVVRPARP